MMISGVRFWIAAFFICVSAALAAPRPAGAADADGSRDHPVLARFPGSEIAYFREARFDEAFLLRAPHDYDGQGQGPRTGPEWLRQEGTVTEIRYAIPGGHSSLEVMRAFRETLAAQRFAIVFACTDEECFSGRLRNPFRLGERLDTTNRVPSLYEGHARYMLARLEGLGGPTHVLVLVGEFKDQTTAFIQVVEPERRAPAPPPPAPKTAECPRFIGEWRNVDAKTRSIPKAVITGSCENGKFVLKAWGACAGKLCDWPPFEMNYRPANRQLIGADRTNYSDEAFRVTLDENDRLRIFSVVSYTDNSGRKRQEITDVMERVR